MSSYVVKIGKKHYEAHSVAQAVELLLKSVNENSYHTHGEGD